MFSDVLPHLTFLFLFETRRTRSQVSCVANRTHLLPTGGWVGGWMGRRQEEEEEGEEHGQRDK